MAGNRSVAMGFVDAVWRRIVLVRIAESMGIAVAGASAAGFLMAPIFWLRGQSPLAPMTGLLAVGAFCGLVWGIARRPTRLAAAMEADRQLGLHDLLGTILLSRGAQTDVQWLEAIGIAADERCRRLRPSAVIANKLGARSWGGIAIASGLLLMVSLFMGQTPRAMAWPQDSGSRNSANRVGEVAPNVLADGSAVNSGRRPGDGPRDENSSRGFDEQMADRTSQGLSERPGNSAATGGGAGSGMATTNTPIGAMAAQGHAGANSSVQGIAGNGTGPGHEGGQGVSDSDGAGTSADSAAGGTTPVWETSSWPAAAKAAESAIQSGRVPDSQADLVRDYFQRD